MSYPTMPRPTDNTGDNHRAAIAALEEAIGRNAAHRTTVMETRDNAQRNFERATSDLADLRDQAASLQRGVDALKAADQ